MPAPPLPPDVPLSPAELATLTANLELAARNGGAAFPPPAVGLLLRLVAEVARCRADPPPVVALGGGVALDRAQRALVGPDGTVVVLTPRPFAVLDCLVRQRPGVATMNALARALWGPYATAANGGAQTIKTYVCLLRRHLDRLGGPGTGQRLIATRLGYGYQARPLPAADDQPSRARQGVPYD